MLMLVQLHLIGSQAITGWPPYYFILLIAYRILQCDYLNWKHPTRNQNCEIAAEYLYAYVQLKGQVSKYVF